MKNLFAFLFLSFLISTTYGQHSLVLNWASDTILAVPESVLFDEKEKCLWVSCIDGKPGEADGKGCIAQLRPDGRIIDKEWLCGLNAPKGMARFGKFLFVADLTELVMIDIGNRKIEKKIMVEGASFLNDVTVDQNGTVYISDSNTGKVHVYKEGTISLFLEKLERPNGLLSIGSDVLVLASGVLYKVGSEKNLVKLAEGMERSTDGIEQVKPGEFVVSCWSGVVYYITEKGLITQLLDTRPSKSNTADIGYDPITRTVFIPTFFKKNVRAYKLK
jgi:hypothetical protein